MQRLILLVLAPAVALLPAVVTAQECDSGGPVAPCNCLTMEPSSPAVGENVTITLYIEGVLTPNMTPDEPICFGGAEELCLLPEEGDEVTFNADGSITFEWTDEMAAIADAGGWAWVWDECCEDDANLAEVLLADLMDDGVGCTTCAGECDTLPGEGPPVRLPATGGLGLGLIAAACALGGATILRRNRRKDG